ncbi:MAG: thiamine pyrophosphate-binding protein, partial [Chloroflexota bacterium]|nr:thiamine pyrophosphate-binding protein [Chloroflexota bacterium]
YGRLTRAPGICYGTNGPGVTNMASGINQAWLVHSPMIALCGQHRQDLDHRGPLQEAYPLKVTESMSKWGVFIQEWRLLPMYLRKAIRDCTSYPPGPVILAIEPRAYFLSGQEKDLAYNVPLGQKAAPSYGGAKPEDIEKVVQLLIEAERPALVGGDGIYWADAAAELRELAELLQVPVSTRRMGRGAVPENHPLALGAGWRLRFWADADVIVAIGIKLNTNLENDGEPPTYPEKAKMVLINECAADAWTPLPTEMEIIANPKVALRQMIDCAKTMLKQRPNRQAWLSRLATVRADYEAGARASAEEVRGNKPIHGFWLAHEIAEFLDPNATVIFDAFGGSAHLTGRLKARFAGQVLDVGEAGGVGHGIGMGIGAQCARPGKQVFVMMGDAGIGLGGMDIETAVRYKLPIVYAIYNNSTWMGGFEDLYAKGQIHSWHMMQDIRYDKMFEPLGCHVENVTEPNQIRHALDRAFNSGKTAVVNFIVDRRVPHPWHLSAGTRSNALRWLDINKVPDDDLKELLLKGPTPEVEEALMKKGYPRLQPKGKVSRGEGSARRGG